MHANPKDEIEMQHIGNKIWLVKAGVHVDRSLSILLHLFLCEKLSN